MKSNVKIENNKIIFSKEVLDYFESIRTKENSIWINKYFEVLSDISNINSDKFNIHHIRPCFSFKDENHKSRKETKKLGDNFNNNLIKLSIYNHLFAHYYLWKIFNNKNSKIAFQFMCGQKQIDNLTENELKEIARLKEECVKENLTDEEYMEMKRTYAKNHKEEKKLYGKLHKEEKAKYDKLYYEQNKDKYSKRQKEYREQNKEKLAKMAHSYYENHKEELYKKHNQYRKQNKEKISKLNKRYVENNKEKIKISMNKYKSQQCYDPIKKNYCTFNALCLRAFKHKDLYKDVIPSNCIIK